LQRLRPRRQKYATNRQVQKLILFLVVAIVAGVVWYDRSRPHPIRSFTSPAVPQEDDFEKYHDKTFVVVKVVDGDTLDINIPDGKYRTTRIRLIGVDTPETKKVNTPVMYYGPEASEFTRTHALGKQVQVFLDTITKTRDRYGRLLAYIKLPDGTILNEILIGEGYGYAYTIFKHSFSNKYVQLERQARAAKRGLWKNITPEQMPEWLQKQRQKSAQTHKKAA
jgi:micrococcal nuclease